MDCIKCADFDSFKTTLCYHKNKLEIFLWFTLNLLQKECHTRTDNSNNKFKNLCNIFSVENGEKGYIFFQIHVIILRGLLLSHFRKIYVFFISLTCLKLELFLLPDFNGSFTAALLLFYDSCWEEYRSTPNINFRKDSMWIYVIRRL